MKQSSLVSGFGNVSRFMQGAGAAERVQARMRVWGVCGAVSCEVNKQTCSESGADGDWSSMGGEASGEAR